jgi:hypothetical protein
MAVTYRASLKTTRMQAVRDDIDSGAGAATLEIGTAGFGSTLVSITLADPASSVAGSVLTFLGVPLSGTAGATGAAAEARIKESSGTVIVSGLTVGTSGTDIIISSTGITSGDTVTMNSGTITHA